LNVQVEGSLAPLTAGLIASAYYISHLTVRLFASRVASARSVADVASLLADAEEFAELPVRHNEEALNEQLGEIVDWVREEGDFDSPHAKTFLLLQTHMQRLPLPIADYKNDSRTALSQGACELILFVSQLGRNSYYFLLLTSKFIIFPPGVAVASLSRPLRAD